MTSEINHNQTIDFFEQNDYFGATKDSFIFFEQAVIPAVDEQGKILMESPGKMVLTPNGNGALFDAVSKNALVQKALRKTDYI